MTQNNDTSLIVEAIKKAVEYEIGVEYDNAVNELTERMERQKDRIVSGVLLNVMKHVEFSTMGTNLVVTIKKIETPK